MFMEYYMPQIFVIVLPMILPMIFPVFLLHQIFKPLLKLVKLYHLFI